jgi:hypothetical protein
MLFDKVNLRLVYLRPRCLRRLRTSRLVVVETTPRLVVGHLRTHCTGIVVSLPRCFIRQHSVCFQEQLATLRGILTLALSDFVGMTEESLLLEAASDQRGRGRGSYAQRSIEIAILFRTEVRLLSSHRSAAAGKDLDD